MDGDGEFMKKTGLKNNKDENTKYYDYQLTQTQLGIYAECIKHSGDAIYNNPRLYKIEQAIELPQLARALEAVVAAHEYIKVRIIVDEMGTPRQHIFPQQYQQTVERMTDAEFSIVKMHLVDFFDLTAPSPLYRLRLIETESAKYFFFDFHHIIFDGTSYTNFVNDLAIAYHGGKLYAESWNSFDIAQEEVRLRQTTAYNTAREWYLTNFKGLTITSLPLPDKNDKEIRIADLRFALTTIDNALLDKFCHDNKMKKSTLFTGVYGLLLAAYTNTDSALFATVFHGRNDPRAAKAIGMMVKTYPVHAKTDQVGKASEYFEKIEEQIVNCRNNSLYSYAEIVAECGIGNLSLFAYHGNLDFTGNGLCGFKSQFEHLPFIATGHELEVEIYKDMITNTYNLHVEWQENLYSRQFIREFINSYEHILGQIINKKELENIKFSDIGIVTQKQKAKLLELGQGKELIYDKTATIIDVFSEQATKTPDAVAIIYKNRKMTYRELDNITDKIARYLVSIGVKSEQAVGIMIDRSEYMAIYPIAVMKAGAAYMPLDYSFPAERLNYMIEDADVKVILSEGNRVSTALGDYNGKVINVEDLAVIDDTTAELPQLKPENMFVILYTSGSTGKPKGCVLEHRNILNFCYWYQKEFNVTCQDCGGAYANFGFDAHMMDLYPLLTCGGAICIIPSSIRLDLAAVNTYLEQNKVSITFFTTQLGRQFAECCENSSLRLMSLGGEKLAAMKKPAYRVYNLYGPTECTLCATFYNIEGDYDSSLIGKPLDNYMLYVLDSSQNLQPWGVPGELCVGGAGVGRGYLNRAELTAEKFIENPFAEASKNKSLYRTGDLVRWSEDGNIEYLGRMDNQVKLRGLRIELGEIESKLIVYPNITAAVVDVKSIGESQNLCAYFTASQAIDSEALKIYLSETLTKFMVPDIYMQLDELPLTPNGKVDRRALPVPEITVDAGEIVAPTTPREEAMFNIVSELLKTDQFGVTNNLFSLGLTSMLAIKLSILLQKKLGLKVTTKDILSSPTIRQMAQLSISEIEAVKEYEKREYYPLTENQKGLYVEWEKNRTALQYNIPLCLKFAKLDTAKLKVALTAVVEAHPYLKTKLKVTEDGEVVQLRLDAAPMAVIVSESLDSEPTQQFFTSRVRSFDLLSDTLYRFEIYSTDTNTYLFSDIHHIIYDGTSMSILLNDLGKAYDGESLMAEIFTAFDQALAEEAVTQNLVLAKQYFSKLLQDRQMTKFPQSLQVEQSDKNTQNIQKFIANDEIKNLCWSVGITESSFFLAAFCVALHAFTAERNVMISAIYSGRENDNLANTIGMFVKTVPIVADLADEAFLDYAKALQEQLWATIGQSEVSFSKLVAEYKINPQINYAYQGGITDQIALAGHEAENIPVELSSPKFPCGLIIKPLAEKYDISFGYDGELYSQSDAGKFVAVLVDCINYFTKEVKASIEQFKPSIKREYYPLSANQLGLVMEYELAPQSLQYNLPCYCKIPKQFSAQAIKVALVKTLSVHHNVLTQIKKIGEDYGQIVNKEIPAIVIKEAVEQEITTVIEEFIQPFKLYDSCLARFMIIATERYNYLLFDIHHILFDGTSGTVLIHDLLDSLLGKAIDVEQIPAYEYALIEKNRKGNSEYKAAKDYFKHKLTGIAMSQLPSQSNLVEGKLNRIIANVDAKAVDELCATTGVSPNQFFMGVFSVILAKYTREDNISFCTVHNGRTQQELSNAIGFFIKTLPFCLTIDESMSWLDYLRLTRQEIKTLWRQQAFSFKEIAEEFNIKENITFLFQKGFEKLETLDSGETVNLCKLAVPNTFKPLSVEILSRASAEYEIRIEYNASMYTDEYIQGFTNAYVTLLNEATIKATRQIKETNMISNFEYKQIMQLSAGKIVKYNHEETFVHQFAKQAQMTPDKIAVVASNGKLTYRELADEADILAAKLLEFGIKQNEFVCIMLPRIKEYMVSTLAVFKAGNAYVPLDSEYPNERLLYMLADSQAKVLITSRELYNEKQQAGDFTANKIIFIDEFDFTQVAVPPLNNSKPNNLAYMIYTSGSTGKPKGVMIQHKAMTSFVNTIIDMYTLTNQDNITCHSSFSFDASIEDLYPILAVGGQLHIIEEDLRHDLTALYKYLVNNAITGGCYTTQLGVELLDQFDLPVRYLTVGGEKLNKTVDSTVTVYNTYGPTEFTVDATYFVVDHKKAYSNIPIGYPLSNSYAYIVDKNNRLVPQGVAGELCLAGLQIAKGYWNRPDLTAEKFIDNPYATCEDNKKMYRTGDLVRLNEHGEIEYLGRIDNQVKLRGFRIELGEIESKIAGFAGITGVVVEVKEIGGVQHLCAYLTANNEVDTVKLQSYLAQSLTDYMVPTVYMKLEKLPLTPNGKINRKALPMPTISRTTEYVAPTNEVETKLCNLFAEILDNTDIGINDDFFKIGGTSMLAIKAIIKINNLGYQIQYGDLFSWKTPAVIAKHLLKSAESDEPKFFDMADYDYSAINKVLEHNNDGLAEAVLVESLGNVLLTGATGYLGVHVLHELIVNSTDKIYCLLRPSKKLNIEARLKMLLMYYFDDPFEDLIGSRIIPLEGDITNAVSLEQLKALPITTVINCAALVKHYEAGDMMDKVNYHGVVNLIEVCQAAAMKLVHVSTYSTAGMAEEAAGLLADKYSENTLYIGQTTDNKYIWTKYQAERAILEAVSQGLKAKIMRVGNLMARSSDGEFQINSGNNAFINLLKSYKVLG